MSGSRAAKPLRFVAEIAATVCIAAVAIAGCDAIASPTFDPLHFLGVIVVGVTALHVVWSIADRLAR